jgi:hypothetical protein
MATIIRTREGTWRAQVRHKAKYASQTFRLKSQACEWGIETERHIDLGCEPSSRRVGKPRTVTNLIDLHIADLQEVGKPLRRSKRAVLEALKRDLGTTRIFNLDRSTLINFGKRRAKQSALFPVSTYGMIVLDFTDMGPCEQQHNTHCHCNRLPHVFRGMSVA